MFSDITHSYHFRRRARNRAQLLTSVQSQKSFRKTQVQECKASQHHTCVGKQFGVARSKGGSFASRLVEGGSGLSFV